MRTVRACFTSSSWNIGSFAIRARQISEMRSFWSCRPKLSPDDVVEHDLFCFVKRPNRRLMNFLRQLGKIVVYDVVDCWRQPDDARACDTLAKIRHYFENYFADFPADGTIFPNRTMLADCRDLVAHPTCIYHHFRPESQPAAVKERPRLVAYEGRLLYLGTWRSVLERICREQGLQFVLNPLHLSDADIGFAARDGVHAALMATRYKSNVKIANFYGAALPALVHADEMSAREMNDPHLRFFRTEDELRAALVELLPYRTRLDIHQAYLDRREQFSIRKIADEFEGYFTELAALKDRSRRRSLVAA